MPKCKRSKRRSLSFTFQQLCCRTTEKGVWDCYDQNGETLPYVIVIVKGTNVGTTTDENGVYEINVDGDVTLIFSYMGFNDHEEVTTGKTRIDVVLLESNVRLEEVVVTGYNTVERRHLASSIESVDVERVITRPIVKLEEIFSGTVPGVTMLRGSKPPWIYPCSILYQGCQYTPKCAPLVIVDGMEQHCQILIPIRSISVIHSEGCRCCIPCMVHEVPTGHHYRDKQGNNRRIQVNLKLMVCYT
jgi:hypothetical protein